MQAPTHGFKHGRDDNALLEGDVFRVGRTRMYATHER